MKLSIRLRDALVFTFLMVSMLIPAKMGLGQGFNNWNVVAGFGKVQPGNVDGPMDVAIDSQGNLFVSDYLNHRIQKLDKSGLWTVISTLGSEIGQVSAPRGLFVDDVDSLWVVDSGNKRIQKMAPDGTWTSVLGFGPDIPIYLYAVCLDSTGHLWVTSNMFVLEYDLSGIEVVHGTSGSSIGQFNLPRDIAIDLNGDVWVADADNLRLQKKSKGGSWSVVNLPLNPDGTNAYPYGLDFDNNGNLWVSEGYGHVLKLSVDGIWSTYGRPGNEVGQFRGASGITVSNMELVHVADFGNDRVVTFSSDFTDVDCPTSTISPSPINNWYNTDITATISSTDNLGGTGVKEIHYTINQGTEQIVSASTATFTLTDNGTTNISYFAVDNAGNTETAKLASVRIDKVAPVTTLSRNAGLISLSATDAHSGVSKIKYQINGGAVVEYSAPFADSIHKVTYWAEDVATNVESAKTDLINAGVQSISVTQNRILGGLGVIGTVTLDKAAGIGGTVVNLASSLPGVAVVDATVTVPEGATTAIFDIDANPVAVDTSVSITASIYETSQSALVTVLAPMPSSITWSTAPVVGGSSTTGTVTLTSPAPAGGTTVVLASSSLSALVASSITIPAGAMTATFTVSTNVVSNDSSAVISATVYGAKLKSTLSILGPKVSSVTLAAASIASLSSTTGTVTLSTNAPVGGKVVTLSSSNVGVASVPVSVTVAAGARTATFTVTAGSVVANTNVTITATTNGSSGTATVTVTPPAAAISGITTNVVAVTGGLAVTGTVTLTRAAPTSGAVVTLASSSTTVGTVPASVTVAAGATTATFTITTRTVTAATTLTVTGTYLGVAKTASITVNPVRVVSTLTLNPTSVRGGTNSTGTITLTGVATEAVVVTLTSGTTTVARVPASVTVPAGSTTAKFTITTLAQTATRTSVITARTGTTSRTATLTVTR